MIIAAVFGLGLGLIITGIVLVVDARRRRAPRSRLYVPRSYPSTQASRDIADEVERLVAARTRRGRR